VKIFTHNQLFFWNTDWKHRHKTSDLPTHSLQKIARL